MVAFASSAGTTTGLESTALIVGELFLPQIAKPVMTIPACAQNKNPRDGEAIWGTLPVR